MSTKIQPTEQLDQYASLSPIIPVLSIEKLEDAVPMCKALVAGGLKVLEVTLRTECGLDSISKLRAEIPDAIVGAGTVANPAQLKAAIEAGSQFIVSPGCTPQLLSAALEGDIPLLPGVSTVSELMMGMDLGYSRFKFFPAAVAGGVNGLKAFGGPFPKVRFCPTGGIKPNNVKDYLDLPNVMCAGGTWLTPKDIVDAKAWDKIEALAAEARALAGR